MANYSSLLSMFFLIMIMAIVMVFHASSSIAATCDDPCRSNDDCDGQLACLSSGKCGDDPDVPGVKACALNGRGRSFPSFATRVAGDDKGTCKASGKLRCGDKTFDQFKCSPPVTSSTKATLSLNNFSKGGDGGSPSKCDERFHDNEEAVVALSTGWYDGGSRCGKKIRITAKNGKSVEAKVVDECDSVNGCDKEHAGLPPCVQDIVDGSAAVWNKLGLNQDVGLVKVTWTMV